MGLDVDGDSVEIIGMNVGVSDGLSTDGLLDGGSVVKIDGDVGIRIGTAVGKPIGSKDEKIEGAIVTAGSDGSVEGIPTGRIVGVIDGKIVGSTELLGLLVG
jgi:hypothetical protein